MFYRFRPLSLATSMLLAVFPLIPLTLNLESVVVQAQTTESTQAESVRLNQEGLEQFNNGQFQAALENFQQALVIVRKIGERQSEGSILNNMGGVYYNLGQYAKALEFYQPALAIKQEFGDKPGEAQTLNNLGGAYHKLGQYTLALTSYQQALVVRQELDDKAGIAQALNNLAGVYRSLGQYPIALERYQQALAIRKELDDKAGIAQTLNNVGVIYHKGEQYAKALEFYQQALTIHRELNNKAGEGAILSNIGLIYDTLGQYAKALEFYQQALAIHTEIGDKELGDRAGEEVALNNIGLIHHKLGQYPQALKLYQQALAISKEIGDRANEATNLSNIGVLLETQNQPELAIVFYKQSVNVTQAIRDELRGLPFEQQKSFIQTVSGRYRRLADLLLKQDRVLEAQQVLDLLKVQELNDYLNTVRGNPHTQTGIDYLPSEQQIVAAQDARLAQIVQLGKELSTLQGIAASDRTLQQEQRRREIEAAQQKLMQDYLDFIRSPQIVTLVEQLTRTTGGENLNPKLLRNLQNNLKQVGQDAVLLYPLILENRLELVLVTPYAPPIRRSVPVNRSDLNRVIAEFRSALTKPIYNAEKPAQQLYNWLIQPIEAALTEANAKTIIYAPDGQLRYIPLAALHDGNQWLVQKYRINNITALSLTEWEKKPQTVKILAGAFSEGNYDFQVGDRTFSLGGLPFAGQEVENLEAIVPDTTTLLDREFSKNETVARMSDYAILHLATHATFVTGKPEDSFILFGNGDRASFQDVEVWPLQNTDLVVLSACETGLGGNLGDGREILGFGYLIQQAGAKAAIASLWKVSDGGTQALMNAFYAALENGNTTKAEALRQAQIGLITGDYTALGKQREQEVRQRIQQRLSSSVVTNLSHPFYWAPFILIGNGL